MRIAIVSSAIHLCPPVGYGSEMTAWYLTEALCRLGHEVILFAPAGSKKPSRGALITIPMANPTVGADIIKSESHPVEHYRNVLERCDVVHDMSLSAATHMGTCQVFGDKVPHLCTLNGIAYFRPPTPWDHNVTVVSNASRHHGMNGIGAYLNTPFEKQFNSDPGTLAHEPFVVRYGLDPNFYRPANSLPSPYLLYVGRPHPSKGLDILLKLSERLPDERFVLAWRADLDDHKHYDRAYRVDVAKRRLSNVEIVELPGDSTHHGVKRDWQAGAAVALHPSTYIDACPSTPIEALLCGTPVVATAHGGNPEIVLDEQDGFCLPIPLRYWEEPQYSMWLDTWAEAILKAKSLDRRDIRTRAVERHSSDRMAKSYLAIYQKLIEERKK